MTENPPTVRRHPGPVPAATTIAAAPERAADPALSALAADARAGLTAEPKHMPPRWFYDRRGSALFEQITELDEYYPTRTEQWLLDRHAAEIAAAEVDTVIELGAGSARKTVSVLAAFGDRLRCYVPQDVSESALEAARRTVAARCPGLRVDGVIGDFADPLDDLPGPGRRMIALLGGTIGNLVRTERADLLTAMAGAAGPGGHVLIGIGLVTDPAVMRAAYDDRRGITAQFNRNVLTVLNRDLEADFQTDAFTHVARWNADEEWIEMRLRAARAMTVRLSAIGLRIDFAAGEEMRTEISAKFRLPAFLDELRAAGLRSARTWSDPLGRFALVCARAPGR